MPVAAPEDLARRFFSEEEIEKARSYHRPLYGSFAASTLVSLAYLLVLAFSPVGRWLAEPVDALARWAFALAYIALIASIGAVLRFPIAFWRGYVHERRWEFSTQRFRNWLLDWAKGVAVQVVLVCAIFLGLVEIAAKWHDAWPWIAAPAAAALVAFLAFVQPVVLEPIFNKFKPLEDRELAADLLDLAERAGTPVRDVLVADASRRTRKENAYVSGLGGTRRVVLFDTLLNRASPREVGLIVAHELGHRRDRHVTWFTLLGAAGAIGGVLVLWALLRSSAVLDTINATGPSDPRIAPFVLLVLDALELLSLPFFTALSRRWEAAADRFGIRLTGDADGYAEMAENLGRVNLVDLTPPRPIYYLLFTHPSIPERIQAARDAAVTSPTRT